MTDENNETHDEVEGIEDASFDSFEKQGTLGDLIRNNPAAKIGVVLVGAAAIFGVIALMGGGDDAANQKERPSFVGAGSEVKSAPSGENVTPAYREAIQEKNEERVDKAKKTGESALPVIMEAPAERLTLKEEEEEQEDPLQRWRRLQEERLEREIRQQKELVQPDEMKQNDSRVKARKEHQKLLQKQMSAILKNTTAQTTPFGYTAITSPQWYESLQQEKQEDAYFDGEGTESSAATAGEDVLEKVIIPAGEIEYAQIITEANSDVPGPVLAMIASGPLTGSKMLGSFTKKEEMLALTFDTVVVDGESYSIDAIALDPETTLPGMATDVDHHYFRRIVMPMAAAFVEGLAEATSETASVVVVTDSGTTVEDTEEPDKEEKVAMGLDKAGEKLGEILDEEGDVEVTVRVEAGTPIGVLFLEPVREASAD